MPKIAATPMIRWKCPTTKYVSCNWMSSTGCARNGPLSPPETNSDTKPMAYSIGVWNRMRPLYIVPSQLNVLMADGTPMHMVSNRETQTPSRGSSRS